MVNNSERDEIKPNGTQGHVIDKRYNVVRYDLLTRKMLLMYKVFPILQEKAVTDIDEYLKENSTQNDIRIFWELINDIKDEKITVVTENKYVDREYRDSYYTHYSEVHQEVSRWCKRLLLFSGDQVELLQRDSVLDEDGYKKITMILNESFIGSIVMKPISPHAVGRTLINPNKLKSVAGSYIRLSNYKICYKDLKLEIAAFPFRMQDEVITSCAEVTLLNVFDYYSSKYNQYAYLMPSNIHSIVRKIKPDRTIPVEGISYDVMSRVLYESGFAPKKYMGLDAHQLDGLAAILPQIGKINSKVLYHHPKDLLGYYVESGMPVGIGLHASINDVVGHSVVCIGHADCVNIKNEVAKNIFEDDSSIQIIDTNVLHKSYIVQDDQNKPYSIMGKQGERCKLPNFSQLPLTVILIPLHRRMYMTAAVANAIFLQITHKNIKQDRDEGESLDIGTSENPLVFRTFLASSGHYRIARLKHVQDPNLQNVYKNINMPHFIWVREIYSKDSYPNYAIGEIVLDATCSKPDTQRAQLIYAFNKRLGYSDESGQQEAPLQNLKIFPYSNLEHIK